MRSAYPIIVVLLILGFFQSSSQNIYWLEEEGNIKKIDISTSEVSHVYTLENRAEYSDLSSIAVDLENQRILLAIKKEFPNKDVLASINLDGTNFQEISEVIWNFDSSSQLFFESIDNVLYYEAVQDNLIRFGLNTLSTTVINENLVASIGFVKFLDPITNRLFGTTFDGFAYLDLKTLQIVRKKLNTEDIIIDIIGVDCSRTKIYLQGSSKIYRCNLDGTELELVLDFVVQEPLVLRASYCLGCAEIIDNNIYFLGWEGAAPLIENLYRLNTESEQISIVHEYGRYGFQELENIVPKGHFVPDISCTEEGNECEIENLKYVLKHYHHIEEVELYSTPYLLKTYKEDRLLPVLGDNIFEVCADGSKASLIELDFDISNTNCLNNLQFNVIDEDNLDYDPDLHGKFIFEEDIDGTLYYKYQHPNWLNNTENPFKDFNVEIKKDDKIIGEFILRVWRPSVLMIHGWLSNGEIFYNLKEELTKSYLIFDGIYEDDFLYSPNLFSTTNTGFEENDYFVLHSIYQRINWLRGSAENSHCKIASGSVDVVAHSTGGLLARAYIQSDFYKNNIHKLITINTPHSGTQWANLVLDDTRPIARRLFCTTLNEFDSGNLSEYEVIFDGCDSKIIKELRVDSDFIRFLNSSVNRVPIHSISTRELSILSSDDIIPVIRGTIGKQFKLTLRNLFKVLSITLDVGEIGINSYLANFVYNDQHDFLVPVGSQNANMDNIENPSYNPNCVTNLFGDHWDFADDDIDESEEIIEAIYQVLLKDPSSTFFAKENFNPLPLEYTYDSVIQENSIRELDLQYTSPLNQQVFSSDDTIRLSIDISGNYTELTAFIQNRSGEYDIYNIENQNATFEISADKLGIGSKKVIAFASDTTNSSFGTSSLEIQLIPTFQLDSITVSPSYLVIDDNNKHSISINGYKDGVTYSLATEESLIFNSQNGNVAAFYNNKLLGIKKGIDSLSVTYNGIESNIVSVEVINSISTVSSNRKISANSSTPMSVYPNPTSDVINIEIESNVYKECIISIFNMTGKQLVQQEVTLSPNDNTKQIETASLEKGVYVISVASSDGIQTAKFIKQ